MALIYKTELKNDLPFTIIVISIHRLSAGALSGGGRRQTGAGNYFLNNADRGGSIRFNP
jgi:hypothetical protein